MNSNQKVYPNFAINLGRQILGNTFHGTNHELKLTLTLTPRNCLGISFLAGGHAPPGPSHPFLPLPLKTLELHVHIKITTHTHPCVVSNRLDRITFTLTLLIS